MYLSKEDSEKSIVCYVNQLSVELVTHIFSRLDPLSLATAAKTCRYWRHIVMDDTCWKKAFLSYFGELPYKRLRIDSWKSEYILRTHLIRKWEKGRGAIMTFTPKIGSIDEVVVNFKDPSMLTASKEQGIALRCNPNTGKMEKDLLYGSEEGIPTQVTSIKMDGNRILWGFSSGFITMNIRAKTLVRRQFKIFSDFHQGAVKVLCLPSFVPDIVLSGGDDNLIKIWNTSTGSSIKNLYGSITSPTCLEATLDHHIISGYTNGTIVVWDLQLNKIMESRTNGRHRENRETQESDTINSYNRRLIQSPLIEKETPVQTIHYDLESKTFIVSYKGLPNLYQYDIYTMKLAAVFGSNDNDPNKSHVLGTICAVSWDAGSVNFTDQTLLDAPLKVNSSNNSNSNNNKKINNDTNQQQLKSNSTSSSSLSLNVPRNVSISKRIIATGDTSGSIYLWPLEVNQDINKLNGQHKIIYPLKSLHGHTSPISVIYMDAFKIVSGADDGWIRIWDPLTGELLHTIGNKIPRHAPIDRTDVSIMRVKNIVCDEYRGIATIGHQVKAWNFASNALLGKGALRTKSKNNMPSAKEKLHYEIKMEVKESKKMIENERKEREKFENEMNKWSLGGLSDEEIMEYALMISQEGKLDNNYDDMISTTSATTTIINNENNNHPTWLDTQSTDYDEDEALLQAIKASLDISSQNTTFSASSSLSLNEDITHNHRQQQEQFLDDASQWPSIGDSIQHQPLKPTAKNNQIEDSELDEELQYVLQLSRQEK
ncbi:WD40-repeat-containing domain protein [Cunninghamella echinulata]|nr:WD40-repeat-containing domain protein [Cunninghamella echinulata]